MAAGNSKVYFFNYSVRFEKNNVTMYDKFNWGTFTVENENKFDPLLWIKDHAKKNYPDHTSLNITALNVI